MSSSGFWKLGKSIVNAGLDTLRQGSAKPSIGVSVRETTWEEFADDPIIESVDNFYLYNAPQSNVFTAVMGDKKLNKKAFSVFRLTKEKEAIGEYNRMKDRLLPLYETCQDTCHVDMLQQWIDSFQAHPHWTAAHVVAKQGQEEAVHSNYILKRLNQQSLKNGATALHIACRFGQTKMIQEFIRSDASITATDYKGNNVFHYAAQHNSDEAIRLLYIHAPALLNEPNKLGYSPLHNASQLGHEVAVRCLCHLGANIYKPNNRGFMPVHLAAIDNKLSSLDVFYQIDPKYLIAQETKQLRSPLHLCCKKETVEYLVKLTNQIDLVDFRGETPLHVMVHEKRLECCISLLTSKANINAVSHSLDTPLHLSILSGNLHIMRCLLVFNAEINLRNHSGFTARHLAATAGTTQQLTLLYNLSLLHAKRCDEGTAGCMPGCLFNGTFEGTNNLPTSNIVQNCKEELDFCNDYVKESIQRVFKKNRAPKRKERLLCLDGGGIRGLMHIVMLREMEKISGLTIKEMFDWIAGTSTGGIVALGIVFGMTLNDGMNLYLAMKNIVFQGQRPYNAKEFEKMLKDTFGEHTTMSSKQYPKVIVTGCLGDRFPPKLHLFRNYDSAAKPQPFHTFEHFTPLDPPEKQLVWMAARASGAAPTFFPSMGKFIDGGLMANNPTLDALTEIHNHNRALVKTGSPATKLGLVVSLGTGQIPTILLSTPNIQMPASVLDIVGTANLYSGAKDLTKIMIEQSTQSEGNVVSRGRAWCDSLDIPFFRFSPLLSTDISLDCKHDETILEMLWETMLYVSINRNAIIEAVRIGETSSVPM